MRARASSRRRLLVRNAEACGEAFEGGLGHRKVEPKLMPELQRKREVLLAERAHVRKRLVQGIVVVDALDRITEHDRPGAAGDAVGVKNNSCKPGEVDPRRLGKL